MSGRARGSTGTRSVLSVVTVLLVVLLSVWVSGGFGGGSDGGATGGSPGGGSGSGTSQTIAYASLPQQAKDTIALIDRGGPYPYRQDDGVFGNREGLLPSEPGGYYREYTVVTPGSDDRGARRIIAAKDDTLYYTDDHYRSFRQVQR